MKPAGNIDKVTRKGWLNFNGNINNCFDLGSFRHFFIITHISNNEAVGYWRRSVLYKCSYNI